VAVFRGRFAESLARLTLADGGACVVVGLATPADRDALCAHLHARLADAPAADAPAADAPAADAPAADAPAAADVDAADAVTPSASRS
jgi:hypothetical protein